MKTVRVLKRLGKIFSGIIVVAAFIACGFCIIAAVQLGTVGAGEVATIGNTKIYGILSDIDFIPEEGMVEILIICAVYCFVEAIVALITQSYFRTELKNDNIFTVESADRTRKVGAIIVVVFALLSVVIGTYSVISNYNQEISAINMACGISVACGIGFMVLSAFMKAGCETFSTRK